MKLLSTLCLLGLSCNLFAQSSQNLGTATNTLDIANIKATIQTGGDFFTKNPGVYTPTGNNTSAGFEVPKGSGKHTIYGGALWIGGNDYSGQIYSSSQTYRQKAPTTPQSGYWPGPIGTTLGAAHNAKYDKIWKVTRFQIQDHISNYANPAYTIPADIATWPGNGNLINGEALQLAPYVDVNNDSIYSPHLGDYPKIKGDQALFQILNDKGSVKVPASPSMNAEIHVMYYAFDTPGNTPIYNTVFTEYRIINRGQTVFPNFYAGIWVDFDLGNWNDDYVGSDPAANRFFVYNGDPNDETVIYTTGGITDTVNGYGLTPPVQSVKFLDQTMNKFMYYYNDNNVTNGNPSTAMHYYNYLQGVWKDGKYLTFGSNGTNQNQPPTSYMYPGKPGSPGWTESNLIIGSNANPPGDRRGLGTIGPFTLAPAQEVKFTVAYTFSQGTSVLNSVDLAEQDAGAVQNFFQNIIIAGNKPEKLKRPLLIFPNPATDQLTIQLPSTFENKTARISITDNVGRKVLESAVTRNSGNQVLLNIESLSKGMYQVTVTSGEETITAKLAKL